MRKLFLALCVFAIAGCSTTGRGYKNPEFAGYQLESTAVLVMDSSEFGVELENRIAEALNKRGVRAFAARDIARWVKSEEELFEKLWARGAKDALAVMYGDASEVSTAGYQVFGSSNTVGGYNSTTATAVPMRRYARNMSMQAALFRQDGAKVWEANTEKFATGLLFTGDGSMMRGSVSALIEAMEENGLLP